MCEQMKLFREMLDNKGIKWEDGSVMQTLPIGDMSIERTWFTHRDCEWSVIHGFGTMGGYDFFKPDGGLLELMSDLVNNGEPKGWLTAEETMELVLGK